MRVCVCVCSYDNGVPIIESPWERLRTQPLDVWISNGTLDGTLSWYSVNSYGTFSSRNPLLPSSTFTPLSPPPPSLSRCVCMRARAST